MFLFIGLAVLVLAVFLFLLAMSDRPAAERDSAPSTAVPPTTITEGEADLVAGEKTLGK